MSLVLQGATSGSITLQEPAVAGTTTINLPATSGTALVAPTALTVPNTTGTVMVSGNMPAFSAYQSSAQTLSAATWTKVTFTTEEFDTNNNFASSTFTPTVAGYYQVSAAVTFSTAGTIGGGVGARIYKNGSSFKTMGHYVLNSGSFYGGTASIGSSLIYFNGSTDYVEIYAYSSSGSTLGADAISTYFQAAMVRTA